MYKRQLCIRGENLVPYLFGRCFFSFAGDSQSLVNRRHQQHFEALKEAEQHNLDQKTVICEIIEAIDYSELTNFACSTSLVLWIGEIGRLIERWRK